MKKSVFVVLVSAFLFSACGDKAEKMAYEQCFEWNSLGSCEEYLADYPEGKHADKVLDRMNELWETPDNDDMEKLSGEARKIYERLGKYMKENRLGKIHYICEDHYTMPDYTDDDIRFTCDMTKIQWSDIDEVDSDYTQTSGTGYSDWNWRLSFAHIDIEETDTTDGEHPVIRLTREITDDCVELGNLKMPEVIGYTQTTTERGRYGTRTVDSSDKLCKRIKVNYSLSFSIPGEGVIGQFNATGKNSGDIFESEEVYNWTTPYTLQVYTCGEDYTGQLDKWWYK